MKWLAGSTVTLLAGLTLGLAQESRVHLPQASTLDTFTGTWSRIEPGQRHALWMRKTEDKGWQVRLFWMTAEGFRLDTSWEDHHEFAYKGHKGFIELPVDTERSTDDRLVINFRRSQDGDRGSRLTERGDLVIYRAGFDGRSLVWQIDPLVVRRTISEAMSPDEEDTGDIQSSRVWTFVKQSVRELYWDEIYW